MMQKFNIPKAPISPETYTTNVFLLMGMLMGIMSRPDKLVDHDIIDRAFDNGVLVKADVWLELVEVTDAMRDLYNVSKESGL
jgi:hypothetical protein